MALHSVCGGAYCVGGREDVVGRNGMASLIKLFVFIAFNGYPINPASQPVSFPFWGGGGLGLGLGLVAASG